MTGARRRRNNAGSPARNRFAGLTGVLAAGLGVLAVVVLAVQLSGWLREHPGPGVGVLCAHVGAAAVAITAQVVVDRERGVRAAICQGTIVVLTGAILVLLWWW